MKIRLNFDVLLLSFGVAAMVEGQCLRCLCWLLIGRMLDNWLRRSFVHFRSLGNRVYWESIFENVCLLICLFMPFFGWLSLTCELDVLKTMDWGYLFIPEMSYLLHSGWTYIWVVLFGNFLFLIDDVFNDLDRTFASFAEEDIFNSWIYWALAGIYPFIAWRRVLKFLAKLFVERLVFSTEFITSTISFYLKFKILNLLLFLSKFQA